MRAVFCTAKIPKRPAAQGRRIVRVKRLRSVEQRCGAGRLVGPAGEIPVHYVLTVSQEMDLLPDGEELPGLLIVSARAKASALNVTYLWTAFGENAPLDLFLEDARKLPCSIHSMQGAAATLVARGTFG
jgi:hypothetical protein